MSRRSEARQFIAPQLVTIFICILLIYIWSMPRTVVLEDDGYFILAAWFNGIAHPPGYPLFTLLGHLASQIPIANVAARVHAVSAVFAALSSVILWLIIYQLLGSRILAGTGAFILAISGTFWSQAIIAEVYTLNCFLFLTLVYLCLKLRESTESHKSVIIFMCMSVVFGFGISNHWPLLLLASPAMVPFLWSLRSQLIQRLPLYSIGLLAGLLPYVWMIFRSQMHPEISFFGPIEDIKGFWFYFSREPYATVDTNISAGISDKLHFIIFHFRELSAQFGPFGWLFVAAGFIRQWNFPDKTVPIALTLAYLGNSLVLIILLGFDFDLFHQAIFRVYPLVSYAVCVIWLCMGLKSMFDFLHARINIKSKVHAFNNIFAVVLVLTTAISNAAGNYRATDTWAEDYARVLLFPLEKNAILFANGDTDLGPLAYMHRIYGLRPDVQLYNIKSVLLSNRLYDPITVENLDLRERVDTFIRSEDRPVYYTNQLPNSFGIENYGLLKRVIKDTPTEYRKNTLVGVFDDYIRKIQENPPLNDIWEDMHHKLLMTEYCRFLLETSRFATISEDMKRELHDLQGMVCDSFHGALETIEIERNSSQPDWDYIRANINRARMLTDNIIVKAELSRLNFYEGEYYRNIGNRQKAMYYYQEAFDIVPDPNGPAANRLMQMKSGSDK